jgi:hypothetical protein
VDLLKRRDLRDPDLSKVCDAGLEAGAALQRLAAKPVGPIDPAVASDIAAVLGIAETTLREMTAVIATMRKRLGATK